MKIAIASDDGISMASHFGRSRYFLVFEVTDGKVSGPESRPNGEAGSHEECGSSEPHSQSHAHNHDAMARALADCQVLLAGGIGWRAAADLQARNIQPMAVAFTGSAIAAVNAYLSGTIKPLGAFCCGHHKEEQPRPSVLTPVRILGPQK
jgi:predicted Fe-Mo cluster-binding NifX family protein